QFIALGFNIYTDVIGRDQIISQSRFLMERMTRELREALPNSTRVQLSGDVQCIEFVPIQASSSYVDIPVFPEPVSGIISVVEHGIDAVDANKIVIYPLSTFDVYGTDASAALTGNIFAVAAAPSNGITAVNLALNNAVNFDSDSPTQRYYLVKNAISYCVNNVSGEAKRFSGYWPPATQVSPPSDWDNGVLMAENIRAGTTPFSYASATLIANAVVQLTLEFERNDETISFNHEVHLVNVP
ncbi:MAG: MSHA biogenesis protein MshO, partial [Phenylobacterium sp.]